MILQMQLDWLVPILVGKMAKVYINSDDELDRILHDISVEVINKVSEKVLSEVEKQIDLQVYIGKRNFYAKGTKRPTYDFRNTWISDINEEDFAVEGQVKQEYNKMRLDVDNFIHGSKFYKDQDVRSFLAEIINEGKAGSIFGYGYWTNPRPFWDVAMEIMKDGTVDKWIKSEFKKRGFTLT